MIRLFDRKDCCGCNACGDACAHNAISFISDNEGFWYPEIDTEKCTDCGMCERVCPIVNIDKVRKNDYGKPICYAAVHKNLEVRFDSTSGGLFSAFAEKIYREQGYVGGAIYDDDFSVRQYISADESDLQKLRSSKYQQSNFEGFYKKVKNIVMSGENVLVCGSPCQMAALRAFMDYRDFDNLYILDYVCRGINSPLVERKFRESNEEKHCSKLIYQKAKNKELGWDRLTRKCVYANGDIEYLTREVNVMNRGFLQTGAFSRPCCYECKFKGLPRMSDISLADFWGIDGVEPSMHDNLGASLVLINSEKGRLLFEKVQTKIRCKEVPFEKAVPGNPALFTSMESKFKEEERKGFFDDLNTLPFRMVADKYFSLPKPKTMDWKRALKQHLKYLKKNAKVLHYDIFSLCRYIKYNYFAKEVHADIPRGGYLLPYPHSVIEIQKGAKVILKSPFELGKKKVVNSKLETRFLVESGGQIIVENKFGVAYGSDIEVFKGATLHIHGTDIPNVPSGSNIGLTIICGDNIDIGFDVRIGRNVTIRDNNGGHYLSMQGYKTKKPIKIGNHVWLCEGCTIMQGVKIGDGAVVAAHAMVIGNVPANCLVAGNPARIIERDVQWKY